MYVSIDLVEEVIERQLRKYKNKLVAKHQAGGSFNQTFVESEDEVADSNEIRIVRTKRFGIKPMFPEDACMQMDLLGHNLFVSGTQRLKKSMSFINVKTVLSDSSNRNFNNIVQTRDRANISLPCPFLVVKDFHLTINFCKPARFPYFHFRLTIRSFRDFPDHRICFFRWK